MNLDSNAVPLRQRLRQASREAILASAEVVVGEHGAHAAKVEAIAARAGVSVGTIYNYFGDREGLVLALYDSVKRQLVEKLDGALKGQPQGAFPAPLVSLFDAVLGHWREHERLFNAMVEDELAQGPASAQRRRTALKEMFDRVERVTRQAVKDGALQPAHADLYPAVILGTLRSLFMKQFFLRGQKTLDVTGQTLVDLFLHGAGRRP